MIVRNNFLTIFSAWKYFCGHPIEAVSNNFSISVQLAVSCFQCFLEANIGSKYELLPIFSGQLKLFA